MQSTVPGEGLYTYYSTWYSRYSEGTLYLAILNSNNLQKTKRKNDDISQLC